MRSLEGPSGYALPLPSSSRGCTHYVIVDAVNPEGSLGEGKVGPLYDPRPMQMLQTELVQRLSEGRPSVGVTTFQGLWSLFDFQALALPPLLEPRGRRASRQARRSGQLQSIQ